jgi:hypothetical protein
MNSFYSVTLERNKYTVREGLESLRKLYRKGFSYAVIVPKKSVDIFTDFLANYDVSVVDESTILDFSKFESLARSVCAKLSCNDLEIVLDLERLGWYYQQVLKLSYLIENSASAPLTMIDADTILLSKLPFFNGCRSNLFATPYEKNKPYLQTMHSIFGNSLSYDKWTSTTCQIISLSPVECKSFIEELYMYLPRYGDESIGEWIARIVLFSVASTHSCVASSLISEQDFVGYFLRTRFKAFPRKLFFLRSGISRRLTKNQIRFITLMGVKHLTYEHWQITAENLKMSWMKLFYVYCISLFDCVFARRY